MLGIIAMGVGFIKKSVPVTILSAVILSSLFSNIVFNIGDQQWYVAISFMFMALTMLIAFIIIVRVKNKIISMEA
ncbi:hypothetical protein D3C81_2214330 [compost metagenome]